MNKGLMLAAFAVLLTGFAFASTMENATGATVVNQSGFGVATTHGNVTTEGGNVSEVNLSLSSSTVQWAGFMGNVTSSLVLAQSGDTQYLFDWTWSGENGTVCASTNAAYDWTTVAAATIADIVTGWANLASGTDSAANTFNTTGSVTVNGVSIGPSVAADTNGDFITVAISDGTVSAKGDLTFCVDMNTTKTQNYRGDTVDYEMIVPTDYAGVETYYFYLELF